MTSTVNQTVRAQCLARSEVETIARAPRGMRWTKARKAALVNAVQVGAYTEAEMLAKFDISVDEFEAWVRWSAK